MSPTGIGVTMSPLEFGLTGAGLCVSGALEKAANRLVIGVIVDEQGVQNERYVFAPDRRERERVGERGRLRKPCTGGT